MSSRWLQELQQVFGDGRVENALEGTLLDPYAKEYNFGLYVVRNAMRGSFAKDLMAQCKADLEMIKQVDEHRHRAVALQGDRSERHYGTVQACDGACRCKYEYEGTKKHKVYGMEEVTSLKQFRQWLHSMVGLGSEYMFNESILNVYSHELDEHIPWHTDQNALYSDEMDGP